ncbi:MAG: S-adenosylmethionine:tRNA ribosyltransferase-isomerase [Chitinophagaceae bacterium]
MHPGALLIESFNYKLPEDRIARFPLSLRDQSKLLVFKSGSMAEDTYSNIAAHLPKNALVVFNNTRVVEARLVFQKPTGGIIEIFILEPNHLFYDVPSALKQQGKIEWECLIGGAGKWKRGQILQKRVVTNTHEIILYARIVNRSTDSFTVEFTWQPVSLAFGDILHSLGEMPIPPYLKRDAGESDVERYQTIYAEQEGSVAAPTAGLHFTDTVFATLKAKQIETAFITLHVGAGTFMPVKSELLEGHKMHEEVIDVSAAAIQQLIDHPHDIFAVGTTSLRTIESLYWIGMKCSLNRNITHPELEIKQWEVYDLLSKPNIPSQKALSALLDWMAGHSTNRLLIKTQIMIAPSYTPKMIRGLITNFHQPCSTLLVLIAALIGDDWKRIYDYALQNDFRFLSYGDGCLLHID